MLNCKYSQNAFTYPAMVVPNCPNTIFMFHCIAINISICFNIFHIFSSTKQKQILLRQIFIEVASKIGDFVGNHLNKIYRWNTQINNYRYWLENEPKVSYYLIFTDFSKKISEAGTKASIMQISFLLRTTIFFSLNKSVYLKVD